MAGQKRLPHQLLSRGVQPSKKSPESLTSLIICQPITWPKTTGPNQATLNFNKERTFDAKQAPVFLSPFFKPGTGICCNGLFLQALNGLVQVGVELLGFEKFGCGIRNTHIINDHIGLTTIGGFVQEDPAPRHVAK
jgi:hypothetical protein